MQIIGFDLLAYPERLDHLKVGKELPYPLPGRHFRPELATSTYSEHLDAWALMERLGFDGIGFNEHHCSPYGLMTSPNLMAAAASQRTSRMKLLVYGNLLPIHEPLRLAEELAMLDCMSGGRLISGFARGIPREYLAYNVPMAESRARFEEAWEIVKLAWTEEVFSYEGRFWSYSDVSIWPRPVQQPHPPVWVPVSMSKETIEWAARQNIPITPGEEGAPLGVVEDIVRYYADALAGHGHAITPDHLIAPASVYVADSRRQAVEEAGTHTLYFMHTLLGHGSVRNVGDATRRGWVSEGAYDYVRPEFLRDFMRSRDGIRDVTLEQLEGGGGLIWGSPGEVQEALIERAEAVGSNTLLLNFNRGAMPHELFVRTLERFGQEVLPGLQAHQVTRVPVA